MELTNDDVRDILRVLDGLPYEELQLETARFRLSLRRSRGGTGSGASDGAWTQTMEVLTAPTELPAADGRASQDEAGSPSLGAAIEADEAGLTDVHAPLLGTFYRAPRPGAPPFVEVGSTVASDTVVCIIETMKLMNSVTAGASGTIVQILVENAQFADQDTVLMRIRQE